MSGDPGDWPQWWQWEPEFTPHLLKRMVDRGFNEVGLRLMLEAASEYRPSASEGRFVIATRFEDQAWEVVVEPDDALKQLVVITAYRKE